MEGWETSTPEVWAEERCEVGWRDMQRPKDKEPCRSYITDRGHSFLYLNWDMGYEYFLLELGPTWPKEANLSMAGGAIFSLSLFSLFSFWEGDDGEEHAQGQLHEADFTIGVAKPQSVFWPSSLSMMVAI